MLLFCFSFGGREGDKGIRGERGRKGGLVLGVAGDRWCTGTDIGAFI